MVMMTGLQLCSSKPLMCDHLAGSRQEGRSCTRIRRQDTSITYRMSGVCSYGSAYILRSCSHSFFFYIPFFVFSVVSSCICCLIFFCLPFYLFSSYLPLLTFSPSFLLFNSFLSFCLFSYCLSVFPFPFLVSLLLFLSFRFIVLSFFFSAFFLTF